MRDHEHRMIGLDPCVRVTVDMDEVGAVPSRQPGEPLAACRQIGGRSLHPFQPIGRLFQHDVAEAGSGRALRHARGGPHEGEHKPDSRQRGAQGQSIAPHSADSISAHQHRWIGFAAAAHHPTARSSSARRRGCASWISLKLA